MQTTTLDRMPIHCKGLVQDITADDTLMHRLQAMGVCRGQAVEVIRHGDPLIVKVGATRIGLSRLLAEKVILSPPLPITVVN